MNCKIIIEYTENVKKTAKLTIENEKGEQLVSKATVVLPANFSLFQSQSTMNLKAMSASLDTGNSDSASVKAYEKIQAVQAQRYLELSGGSGFCAVSDENAKDKHWPRDQAFFLMDKKTLEKLMSLCSQGNTIAVDMNLKKSAFLLGQHQVSEDKQDIKKLLSDLNRHKIISQNKLENMPGMSQDNINQNLTHQSTITATGVTQNISPSTAPALQLAQDKVQGVAVVLPKTDYYSLLSARKEVAEKRVVSAENSEEVNAKINASQVTEVPVISDFNSEKMVAPVAMSKTGNKKPVAGVQKTVTPRMNSATSNINNHNNMATPLIPGVDYYNDFGMLNPAVAAMMTPDQRQNQWNNPYLVQQRMQHIFKSNYPDPNDPYGNNNGNNGFNY
jgi:hypothetical protein